MNHFNPQSKYQTSCNQLEACGFSWRYRFQRACLSWSGCSALAAPHVEGERLPGLQTVLARPSFVSRLARFLPLLLLCVWTGPAGPAWRREGGPSVPSPATWLPRGEGGVEGSGWEGGQSEKETFPLLFFFFTAFLSGLLLFHPLLGFSSLFLPPPSSPSLRESKV